jgi:hypothetical protein
MTPPSHFPEGQRLSLATQRAGTFRTADRALAACRATRPHGLTGRTALVPGFLRDPHARRDVRPEFAGLGRPHHDVAELVPRHGLLSGQGDPAQQDAELGIGDNLVREESHEPGGFTSADPLSR